MSILVVKKYSNRRLYDTEDSRYITLDDLSRKIRDGKDVKVVDAKSGTDLTQNTLSQIVLESRGAAKLLPVPILTQMVRMDDDALHEFMERYMGWALSMYTQARQNAQAMQAMGGAPNPYAMPGMAPGGYGWGGNVPGYPPSGYPPQNAFPQAPPSGYPPNAYNNGWPQNAHPSMGGQHVPQGGANPQRSSGGPVPPAPFPGGPPPNAPYGNPSASPQGAPYSGQTSQAPQNPAPQASEGSGLDDLRRELEALKAMMKQGG